MNGEALDEAPSHDVAALSPVQVREARRISLGGPDPADDPLLSLSTNLVGSPPKVDTSRIDAAVARRSEAAETAARSVEAKAGEQRRELAGTEALMGEQAIRRDAARPAPVTLDTPPSMAPRAFLDPGEGVLQQIQGVMLGLGQLAMQVSGLRGSAAAATASLKGAVEGWQAGDAERVKRSLTAYETNASMVLRQHALDREAFTDLLTDQTRSLQERLAVGTLRAKIAGDETAAQLLRVGDLDQAIKHEETKATLEAKTVAQHAALVKWIAGQTATDRRHADSLAAAGRRHAESLDETKRGHALANMDPQVRHYLSDVLLVDPLKATDADVRRAVDGVEAKRPADEQRKRTERSADRIATAEAIRDAVSDKKLNAPIGKDAAHFADAQGRQPHPLTPTRDVYANYRPFQGKVPPETSSAITLYALDQALALIPSLDKKGLMAQGTHAGYTFWAWLQREAVQRNDPELRTFISHTSTLVRTARELGDIGFRAQAAIEGTLNIVAQVQTAEGATMALKQLRNLVVMAAPATVPRKLRVFDTATNQFGNVTLAPGETLNDVPARYDVNR